MFDWLTVACYVYLTLPIGLFAIGWLKWYYALIFIAVMIISTYSCLKICANKLNCNAYNTRHLFWLTLIIAGWVGLSGIGGFAYQNWDHEFRNAVLHDLIDFPWPVLYNFPEQPSVHVLAGHKGALIYYITFWLPAAAIGKLLGWKLAILVLYLWSVLGIILSLLLLMRYLKKFSYAAVLIFIFWSGIDILGYLTHGHLPRLGEHLEWWAGIFQYSSNTTTLFWAFNQTITTWLVVMMILNNMDRKNLIFTYALSFPFAPLPCIGLIPFIIYSSIFEPEKNSLSQVWARIRQGITFQNIIGAPMILMVFYLYFTSNNENIGISQFVWHNADLVIMLIKYILFVILEFGLYAFIIKDTFISEPYFIISIFTLLIIPFYIGGLSNDFAMRASIPALVILMVYVVKYILNAPLNRRVCILIFLLMLGAITPINEIMRSVEKTYIHAGPVIADNWRTFSELKEFKAKYITNFVGRDPERTIFFNFLSREN